MGVSCSFAGVIEAKDCSLEDAGFGLDTLPGFVDSVIDFDGFMAADDVEFVHLCATRSRSSLASSYRSN